ncbi:MAG: amidohydrolase [Bulleidia sp.]|nr:amidohydrolase [Erysipelotrichaceae bacterium]MDY2779933.1 amidohydrolase [Bulleidia sp.]
MLLIKNGLIHDLVNKDPYLGEVLCDGTKIKAIGKKVEAPSDVKVLDAGGMNVYPGFIDAHSHLGLDGYGIGFEGQDYNEMNDICTPQLRTIDSFNPLDPTVSQAMEAGVTCVATGQGSSNAIGGTWIAVKTVGTCVDDMIVKDPVAMKCALGENPKRCYKDKGNYARMTTAFHLREMILKAKDYKARKDAASGDVTKMPAYDMKCEAMIPVLNREIPLKIHAHQANDILTAIRIAKEFDLKLTLEHVTEGHLIVDTLAKYKDEVPMAVGPTLTHASKFELQNKSWTTPAVLSNAGCMVSIITDAPVIPLQHLPLCASLAVKAGMDPYEALKAITINPARHIGIEDRVGSLEVGKDADVIIYNGDPFDVASTCEHVVIDGELVK